MNYLVFSRFQEPFSDKIAKSQENKIAVANRIFELKMPTQGAGGAGTEENLDARAKRELSIGGDLKAFKALRKDAEREYIRQCIDWPSRLTTREISRIKNAHFPDYERLRREVEKHCETEGVTPPIAIDIAVTQSTEGKRRPIEAVIADGPDKHFQEFCKSAARILFSEIEQRPPESIGLAWGPAIRDIAKSWSELNCRKLSKSVFYPLSGEPLNAEEVDISPNDAVRRLSQHFKCVKMLSTRGIPTRIPPSLASSIEDFFELFLTCNDFREIFDVNDGIITDAPMIVTGIGDARSSIDDPWFIEARELESQHFSDVSVGNISGLWLPKDKKSDQQRMLVDGINDRWIGVSKQNLRLCFEAANRHENESKSEGADNDSPSRFGVVVVAHSSSKVEVLNATLGMVNRYVISKELASSWLSKLLGHSPRRKRSIPKSSPTTPEDELKIANLRLNSGIPLTQDQIYENLGFTGNRSEGIARSLARHTHDKIVWPNDLSESYIKRIRNRPFDKMSELRSAIEWQCGKAESKPPSDIKVVARSATKDKETAFDEYSERAGELIRDILKSHSISSFGCAWGRTIESVVENTIREDIPLAKGCKFFPLAGEPLNHTDRGISPSEAAQTLAHHFGCKTSYSLRGVPTRIPKSMESNREAFLELFQQSNDYKEIFDPNDGLISNSSMILTGIGDTTSSHEDAWFTETRELEGDDIVKHSVGNIGGIWLKKKYTGKTAEKQKEVMRDINSRWLGVKLDDFRNCFRMAEEAQTKSRPGVVLVAHDPAKVEVLNMTLGIVNQYIIGKDLALAWLKLIEQKRNKASGRL